MRRLSGALIVAAGLGVAAGTAVLGFLRVHNGPRVSLEQRVIDFGQVSPGGAAEKAVRIRNAGRGVLLIEDVRLACQCGHVNLDKRALGPGETATLSVTVHGNAWRGMFESSVWLVTNDRHQPLAEIAVRYSTLRGVWTEPGALDFGRVLREALPVCRSAAVFMDGSLGSSAKVRSVEADTHLNVEVASSSSAQGWRVAARLRPSVPSGQYRSEIVLRLDNGIAVRIPVHATVRGEVFAVPPALVVGPLDGAAQGVVGTIRVVRRNGPLTSLDAQASGPLAAMLDCQPVEDHTIHLFLRSSAAFCQRAEGCVVIKAQGPGLPAESLAVPVVVVFQPPVDAKGHSD